MQVIRFLWGVFLVYFWFVAIFMAFALLAGCSATGEMPVCESGCTMTKSWGLT